MRKNRRHRYDAATSSPPLVANRIQDMASARICHALNPAADHGCQCALTRRRTFKPEPTGASMSSILKEVQTDETTTLAQQAQQAADAPSPADQTDGFHLLIDALKANDVETIYG